MRTASRRLIHAARATAWFVVAASSVVHAQGEAATTEPGTRRALFIGINDYASGSVPDLAGCVNDIEGMRATLTTRFGFSEENIRTLRNEEATRARILAALDELVETAGPADLVFIHYAGHGSQVEDLDGDEEDGKDETLVTYDSRTPGIADITDDELHARLGRLRSNHTVVVLDCCHSGTGTRSVGVRPRRLEPDTRTELYPQPTRTRAVVRVETENYILMTGAADHQSALDGPIAGRYHGAFSYALTQCLAKAPTDVTSQALFGGIEREMRRLGDEEWRIASMPEPQLEGPAVLLEEPWMPRAAGESQGVSARLTWVSVERNADGAYVLDASVPSVVPGSLWALYPADETEFTPDGLIAVAEVLSDTGDLLIDPTDASVGTGTRATLLAPPPTDDILAVHFLEADDEMSAYLEDELNGLLPGLSAVSDGEFADLVVDLSGDECLVYGADGSTLLSTFSPESDEHLIDELAMMLERCLTTAVLLSVDNPASSMELELVVGRPKGRHVTTVMNRGFKVVKVVGDTSPPTLRVRKGDDGRNTENSLQLSIRADRDCYITIVDIDVEGALTQLFPNDYANAGFHPDGWITGGSWHLIPDQIVPEGDGQRSRAGFQWDVVPPTGLDTLRVFACTELEVAEEIRSMVQEAEGSVGTRSASAARARLADLPRALATRGFKVVRVDNSSSPEVGNPTGTAGPVAELPPLPSQPEEPGSSDWTAVSMTVRIVD